MKRTFYGIVCEQDLPKERTPSRVGDDPRGPILMETYLDGMHVDRAKVEEFARTRGFDRYGWVAIAEITVEVPEACAEAIPAAVASVHA
jgi:hypothetical protein